MCERECVFDTSFTFGQKNKNSLLLGGVICLPNFPMNLTGIKDVTKSVDNGIHLPTFIYFYFLFLLGLKQKLRKNKAKQNPCSTIHTTGLSQWPDVEGEHFPPSLADKSASRGEKTAREIATVHLVCLF